MVIVVLGACGFIGSHLVDALVETVDLERHVIVAVASYRSDGKTGWLDRIDNRKGLVRRRGDITDATFLKSLAPNLPNTLIYNLAAHISVPGSLDLPERYWEVNATAVLKLLLLYNQARIVQISTSEVFAGLSSKIQPYHLGSKPDPVSWYGAAKAASEMLVRASNTPNHIFVRLFNTYGPRQFPRAVIPYMLRQALQIRAGKLDQAKLGDPTASRGFNYVWDVAAALASLHEVDWEGHMQWASPSPITIRLLWEMVAQEVEIDPTLVTWDETQRPKKVKVQALFGERSENIPGRAAKLIHSTSLVQGLKLTRNWLERHAGYAAEGYYQ